MQDYKLLVISIPRLQPKCQQQFRGSGSGNDSVFNCTIETPTSTFAPEACSTPSSHSEPTRAYRGMSQMSTLRRHETNFRTLVVNCNSAKSKQAELAEYVVIQMPMQSLCVRRR